MEGQGTEEGGEQQQEQQQTTDMSAVQAAVQNARAEDTAWGDPPPDSLEEETPAADAEAITDEVPSAEAETLEGEQPEEAEAEGEGDEEESKAFAVQLPGRGPDDPDIEIEVGDEEIANRLRQMRKGYDRKNRLDADRADVQQKERELDEVDTLLRADPVGFVLERVNPEIKKQLALNLLADDEIYEHVVEQIADWEQSPDKKEGSRLKLENDRLKSQGDVRDQLDRTHRFRDQGDAVDAAIDALVPDTMDEDTANLFLADARRDMLAHIQKEGFALMNDAELEAFVAKVPSVLARRLRLYGIAPRDGADGGSPPASTATPVARPATPEAARLVEEARATPERVRKTVARRKAAGAAAPSGHGLPASPPGIKPPPGAGVKEAIAHARKHMLGA
jgi:hypothetical protein